MMRNPFAELREKLEDRSRLGGLFYALQAVLNRIIPKRLFDANCIEIYMDAHQTSQSDRDVEGNGVAEVRWGTQEDLDSLVHRGCSREELLTRFGRGACVALCEPGGEIVGWNWFEQNDHDDFDWLRFTLSPGDVWAFDGYVAPDQRGKGIYAGMRKFAMVEFSRAGGRRILSWTESLNRSSVRARTKAGSSLLGRICWLRVLTITLVRDNRTIRIGRWRPERRLELPLEHFGNGPGSRK